MAKYKAVHLRGGYENRLTVGNIYEGEEQPGIFQEPYLVIPEGDDGQQVVAHLHRFEKVSD